MKSPGCNWFSVSAPQLGPISAEDSPIRIPVRVDPEVLLHDPCKTPMCKIFAHDLGVHGNQKCESDIFSFYILLPHSES